MNAWIQVQVQFATAQSRAGHSLLPAAEHQTGYLDIWQATFSHVQAKLLFGADMGNQSENNKAFNKRQFSPTAELLVVVVAAALRVTLDPARVWSLESVVPAAVEPVSVGVAVSAAVVPWEASSVAVKLAESVGTGPFVAGPVVAAAPAYLVHRPTTFEFLCNALQMVGCALSPVLTQVATALSQGKTGVAKDAVSLLLLKVGHALCYITNRALRAALCRLAWPVLHSPTGATTHLGQAKG
ncbi:hypothetical protein TgHK011_009808 [Trichoderma gracile]|nr:hypothetical protein TgHK011_009808 [Trichoderma gracile]